MSTERPLPQIGDEIAAHVTEFCKRRGMDPQRAQDQGEQIAELMLTIYAGEKIRFPANPFREAEILQRDQEIRSSFDGQNTAALAQRFGISSRRVQQIVKHKGSIVSRRA